MDLNAESQISKKKCGGFKHQTFRTLQSAKICGMKRNYEGKKPSYHIIHVGG